MICADRHLQPTLLPHLPSDVECQAVVVNSDIGRLCIAVVYLRPALANADRLQQIDRLLGVLPHLSVPTIVLGRYDFNKNKQNRT